MPAAVPSTPDRPSRRSRRSLRSFEVVLLAIAAAVAGYQLFVPPVVGLANNGDFSRVAEPLGIFPPPEIGNAAFFDWIVPEYRFDPKRIWFHGLCCYSSETLFGILSVFIGLVISPPGGFDLRAIGVANLLGFLVAFGLILEALRSLRPALSISGGLLLLVIFTDVAYVSYLNSFYTEPAALVFFLGSIGLALLVAERQDPPLWMPAAFLLSATLLATSRPQNALLGPLLALLAIRLSWGDRDASRRRHLVIGAAGVCLVSLAYLRGLSGPLGRVHLYNAVFRELLTTSAEPKRDLAELDLSPGLDRLVGTTAFSPNVPIDDPRFRRDFFGRIGYGRLARFYAAHPRRMWKALERCASHAFDVRPANVGNYSRESGRLARARAGTCAIWSRAKERIVPARLSRVIAYLMVNLVAAFALRLRARNRPDRLRAETWIGVVVVAAFQFSISAVMDHESRRSLFLFNVAADILFVALCLRAGTVFASQRAGWGREARTAGPDGDGAPQPLSRH